MGNIPLSPQNTRKIASSLLERDFLLCFATPRRRRGGMCKGTKWLRKSLRVRDVLTVIALAFQLARAPRRAFWDVGAQRRNPSIRTNQTEKWTKFWNSWLNRVSNIFHFNQGDRFVIWNYIILIMKNQVSDRGGYLVWFHSFFYESQFCDSAKESIYFLHTSIFYCYLLYKTETMLCDIASVMNTEGKRNR